MSGLTSAATEFIRVSFRVCACIGTMNRLESPSPILRTPSPPSGERGHGSWRGTQGRGTDKNDTLSPIGGEGRVRGRGSWGDELDALLVGARAVTCNDSNKRVLFPLTPALSLGERENRIPPQEKSRDAICRPTFGKAPVARLYPYWERRHPCRQISKAPRQHAGKDASAPSIPALPRWGRGTG